MTLRPDVLAAILGMALATFLCRAGGTALLRATRPPPFVGAMLRHLPGCLFVAFLAPALASGGPAAWAAAAATVAAQAAFRRLALSIAAGVAVLWLLRLGPAPPGPG
jgi:branched chain amino acid efflux pump